MVLAVTSLYRVLVFGHVACAIVGFGALALEAVVTGRLDRFDQADAYAVARASYTSIVKVAEKFLYALPVFGIGAVLASDGQISFGTLWVSLSFVVFIAALGVLHGILNPARRRMLVLLGGLAGAKVTGAVVEAPSELIGLGRRLRLGNALLNLTLALALVLMIWQPS